MLPLYLFFVVVLFIVNLVVLVVCIISWKATQWEEDKRNVKYAFVTLPLILVWPLALVGLVCYGIYYLIKVALEVFGKTDEVR